MTQRHATTLTLCDAVATEVEIGGMVTLRLRAVCAEGCDLAGRVIVVTDAAAAEATATLVRNEAGIAETGDVVVRAPLEVGDHAWTASLPEHQAEGVTHDGYRLSVALHALAHRTSAAVWDAPSPVAIDSRFTVKVGVACSARCALGGRAVEVLDETGHTVGEARLGPEPWPGTRALDRAELDLRAPSAQGLKRWTVRFTGEGLTLAHGHAAMPFTFLTNPPPEHRVTLTVIGQDSRAPIGGADVRVGAYRSITGDDGVACVDVPAGTYDVLIWRDGYAGPATTVQVRGPLSIAVEAVTTLTAAEREELLERHEASQWG